MTQQLFSIDVDAHLRKAASHTFSSPAHYPVELVRAALRRGAGHVEIDVDAGGIRIKDNGAGLDETDWAMLRCLVDKNREPGEKETAVEWLQTRKGQGMLAIFAPNPHRFTVENSSSSGRGTIRFRNGEVNETAGASSVPGKNGTVITLSRKNGDVDQEKEILNAFCRSVPRALLLNKISIGGKPFLHGQMGTLNKTVNVSGVEVRCVIGIPKSRNMCHIRFLDQSIPWHHVTLPPQNGFVFDAALEYTGELNPGLTAFLCKNAQKLYHWLTQRYPATTPPVKRRIEELLFTHARITGDTSLVDEFAPFSLYQSDGTSGGELNLSELRQAANMGGLYAVPRGKEGVTYNTGNKLVLSLRREQADFLINTLKLPVAFLTPSVQKARPLLQFKWMWRKRWRSFLLTLFPKPKQIPECTGLTEQEIKFMATLNSYLSCRGRERAVWVPTQGPFPGFRLDLAGPDLRTESVLAVRRRHRLVRRAVAAVERDPRYIEMVVPLLDSDRI